MARSNRQILLNEIPKGKLALEHFRQAEASLPTHGDGEVLARTRYVALDAANRAWMLGATYRAGLIAGQVTGLTAYFGLLECGKPAAGETVVVSAAAGAVGSIVGQIAKLKGCRTVGIAGGADKCALLRSEFGFDATVDYKAHAGNGMALYTALQSACGGGIDVYFDNVGGEILDACLFLMKTHGRVACCGAVSMYDGSMPYGVRGIAGIVSKRVTLRGFIVSDFYQQRDAALADLQSWVESGQLRVREDVIDGLENLPAALIGLLAGENVGKRMVKVA